MYHKCPTYFIDKILGHYLCIWNNNLHINWSRNIMNHWTRRNENWNMASIKAEKCRRVQNLNLKNQSLLSYTVYLSKTLQWQLVHSFLLGLIGHKNWLTNILSDSWSWLLEIIFIKIYSCFWKQLYGFLYRSLHSFILRQRQSRRYGGAHLGSWSSPLKYVLTRRVVGTVNTPKPLNLLQWHFVNDFLLG